MYSTLFYTYSSLNIPECNAVTIHRFQEEVMVTATVTN